MQLIGMLDSPYVRRVAVALLTTHVAFEHKPVSVLRNIEIFTALSPLLKAPSLIVDGATLVESSVILEYLGSRHPAVAALAPATLPAFLALGNALTVMEKAVQIVYERNLRSPEERSESWRERVTRQLHAGLDALEASAPEAFYENHLGHADIAVACAWGFASRTIGDVVTVQDYPRLATLADRAESLPAFRAAPAVNGAKVEASR